MTRRTRTLIVLAVALVAAVTASLGVYTAIARIPVRNVEIATNYAVVAARPLPMGTLLTADDVKRVAWPARTPLQGGYADVDAVVGRGLINSVVRNEPIVASKLAARDAGAGLPPSIPQGMRAMSVKVNEVIGVAGFVVPGTRVDVMVIIRQQNDSMARTVASNVQVLTAGTRYDQENAKDGKPIPSTVITLMVAPPDAERIALAQSEGQIMLALRNPLDADATATSGIRTAGLLGASSQATPPPSKGAARRPPAQTVPVTVSPLPVPAVYTVEAIRGAKRTEEVVH